MKSVLFLFVLCILPANAQELGYVLQADKIAGDKTGALGVLTASGRDVLVLDEFYETDNSWTPDDLKTIRAGKPGRRVVAYLSIGEAEDYRPYWQAGWKKSPPGFLLTANPDWPGNFRVKYWDPLWQKTILASLDRILAAGFDGIYLDIVDAFEGFERDPVTGNWRDNAVNLETKRTFREDMLAWVRHLADHARASRPGFLVIPQNGEQLLADPGFSEIVSAIGVEDLFTLDNRISTETNLRSELLDTFQKSGKSVFAIEYARKPGPRDHARTEAAHHKFSLLLTARNLDTLGEAFAAQPPAQR